MAKDDRKAAEHCSRCAAREQDIEARYVELATLQRLVVDLDRKTKRADAQLDQTRSALTEARAARTRSDTKIAQIKASTSWRLTAPLRAMLQRFRPG